METFCHDLPFFKKRELVTTKHLGQLISGSTAVKEYLPDSVKVRKLPRSFLFTLIFSVQPILYADLKKKVEARKASQQFKALAETTIVLHNEILAQIDSIPEEEVFIFI